MEEVFQDYQHYKNWILNNWNKNKVLDSIIIEENLLIEKKNSCNGEPYRNLTREEFNERESTSFIVIPKI